MFDKDKIHELYPEAENLMVAPMLIWKLPPDKKNMFSEVCFSGEYFLQEKIDGGFYQFVKTDNYSYLFGRTVSKTTGILTEKSANVPHIVDAFASLPAGTIIIGEIYVPGGTSKNVTHIMGCLPAEAIKRQKVEGNIHYYCHDIIAYKGLDLRNEGAETRYNILQAIWKLHELDKYDFLRLATKVDTGLEEETSRILKSGGEGAVLKKRNAPYVAGKRPAWQYIKCKQMDAVDLVCMGFCEPTKEYTGKELNTWEYWEDLSGNLYQGRYLDDNGYATIKTPMTPVTKPYFFGWKTAIEIGAYNDDGKLVKLGTVSSGLTDVDKEGMSTRPEDYLYKVVALDCMSIDKKEKTLRHPALREWRPDKNAKECLISEIFG